MASVTIRRLDETVKSRLRIRAARHGRSMEEEAREILKIAVMTEKNSSPNLAEAIRRRIDPLGGVNLTIPSRQGIRRPPALGK
jgi:plasmid stability protein